MPWDQPAPGLGELPAPGRPLLCFVVAGELVCGPGKVLGPEAACCPPPGSTAMPTTPLDALQATAPTSGGLSATSTSSCVELPAPDGGLMASTTAFWVSASPGSPGQPGLPFETS